jgi:putative tricarboxylic transport membrane protein
MFGLAIAATGIGLAVAGRDIGFAPLWGPALMPMIVASGLTLLGLMTTFTAWRGGKAGTEADGAAAIVHDWPGFGWVLAALVVFAALVEPLGFSLAAAVLFALVARGFASRRPLGDFAIGLALTLAIFLVFAKGLGLTLPAGMAFEMLRTSL